MSFELKYAFRNLRFRRGGLSRLTAVSAVLGIAFGVASLIVVQAVYKGFRDGVEAGLLENTAHLTVSEPNGIDPGLVKNKISAIQNVERVRPVLMRTGVVTFQDRVAYAVLSVEFDNQEQINAAVGKTLAKELNAKSGSRLEFMFPGTDGPERIFIQIDKMIDTGLHEFDSALISVSSRNFEINSGSKPKPNTYLVKLKSPLESGETAKSIRTALGPGFIVEDWKEANRPLFTALSFERRIANIVLLLMIGIASLGITATLTILVTERSLEIAVLKTCGAQRRSIAVIFLTEGLTLGVAAIAAGMVLGVAACWAANYFGLANLPGEVYSISHLELKPDIGTTGIIALGTLFITLASVVFPVMRASRSNPSAILRSI